MKNERTCIACRKKFDKTQQKLIKITKCDGEIFVNTKVFGRSCYVCDNEQCINKTIKNKLINKAFRCAVNNGIYEKLEKFKGLYD